MYHHCISPRYTGRSEQHAAKQPIISVPPTNTNTSSLYLPRVHRQVRATRRETTNNISAAYKHKHVSLLYLPAVHRQVRATRRETTNNISAAYKHKHIITVSPRGTPAGQSNTPRNNQIISVPPTNINTSLLYLPAVHRQV